MGHNIFSGNVQHIRRKTSTTFIHWKQRVTLSCAQTLCCLERDHMGHVSTSNENLGVFIFEEGLDCSDKFLHSKAHQPKLNSRHWADTQVEVNLGKSSWRQEHIFILIFLYSYSFLGPFPCSAFWRLGCSSSQFYLHAILRRLNVSTMSVFYTTHQLAQNYGRQTR